jgi:hypothetical protein
VEASVEAEITVTVAAGRVPSTEQAVEALVVAVDAAVADEAAVGVVGEALGAAIMEIQEGSKSFTGSANSLRKASNVAMAISVSSSMASGWRILSRLLKSLLAA